MTKSEPTIRLLLVDDHETMLWGLERLIESSGPKMVIVGEARTAAQATALAAATRPDVILLDLDLGDELGIDAIPQLLTCGAQIVVVTGVRENTLRDRAILAGARGIVGKDEPPATILKAIEKVHAGELWLDRSSTARILVDLSRQSTAHAAPEEREKIDRLTPREREIVRTLAQAPGKSIVDVAKQLGSSESTLRNQLTSIYGKLGLSGRFELNVYASKNRLD